MSVYDPYQVYPPLADEWEECPDENCDYCITHEKCKYDN